jgi:hypothetical protein
MIKELDWPDKSLTEDTLTGVRLIGPLKNHHIWPLDTRDGTGPKLTPDEFLSDILSTNNRVLGRIRPADTDGDLWKETEAEIRRGWLGEPVRVGDLDLSKIILVPRFPVFQGKVRPIDDFKANKLNRTYASPERLTVDGSDHVVSVLRHFLEVSPDLASSPGSLKGWSVDEWKAYKQRALCPEDQARLFIVYHVPGVGVRASQLRAMPFGASASVLEFNRIPKLLATYLRVALKSPTCSYFDDFFGLEPSRTVTSSFVACQTIHELAGILIAEPEWPEPFRHLPRKPPKLQLPTVRVLPLGILYDLENWIACNTPERIAKYTKITNEILSRGTLSSGESSSLRGKFQFAVAQLWGKLGRASIRALSERQYRSHGHGTQLTQNLGNALSLLTRLLSDGEPRPLPKAPASRTQSDPPHLVVYTDAEGSGGIGAVLFRRQAKPIGFAGEIPLETMHALLSRKLNVIQPLEAFVPLIVLLTFPRECQNTRIIFYQDNVGCEAALLGGSSTCPDTNLLVGLFWEAARLLKCEPWIERVMSSANVADIPSRFKLTGNRDLSAIGYPDVAWSDPVIPKIQQILVPTDPEQAWDPVRCPSVLLSKLVEQNFQTNFVFEKEDRRRT